MKKEFKKQIFIGIGGCLGSAGVFAACYLLWRSYVSQLVIDAVLAVFAACFFGSLLYIFGGRKGFINGAVMGFIFVALKAAAFELPGWLFGCIMLAVVMIFIVRPLINQYGKDSRKSSGKAGNKKVSEDIDTEKNDETEMLEESDEFKRSIRFGEKSLLLLAGTGGMYQLIKSAGKLFFVRIGGELSGLDSKLLVTDFTDGSTFLKGKKDFSVSPNDITNIRFNYRKVKNIPIDNCGEIWINTEHKRYHFAVLDNLPIKKIESYFAGLPMNIKSKNAPSVTEHKLTEEESKILPALKKVCLALTVSAFVFGAALVFLPVSHILYSIFSVACILIPVVTFTLYMRFDTLLSADDRGDRRSRRVFSKSGINITTPLIIPSAALAIRTIYDFTITGWVNLIIWSAGIIAVVLLLLFLFTKEYKRVKSVIALIVLALLFYAPSAVIQVNGLFDYSAPTVYASSLIDKHISTSSRGGTHYYITVQLENGSEKEISVDRAFYQKQEAGGIVSVVERKGLLGIGYVYIDED